MIVTSQPNLFSKDLTQHEISIPGFIRGMHKMHQEPIASKDDLSSFNLVEFALGTNKQECNLLTIHGQILDFDGCEAPLEDVLAVFRPYQFIAYSSFNNGIKGAGARFRLVLPYASPIWRYDWQAQKNIYEHIFDVFAEALAHLPSGLDTSKRNPGAFYKRPCMTDHPIWVANDAPALDWSAFIETEASRNLALRKNAAAKVLDERKAERAHKAAEQAQELTPAQKDKAAENSLRKFGYTGSGTGNIQFFKYAKSLAGKGFNEFEVEELLKMNLDAFGNAQERRKEIKHILKGIFK